MKNSAIMGLGIKIILKKKPQLTVGAFFNNLVTSGAIALHRGPLEPPEVQNLALELHVHLLCLS